jgi:hypothetical protein
MEQIGIHRRKISEPTFGERMFPVVTIGFAVIIPAFPTFSVNIQVCRFFSGFVGIHIPDNGIVSYICPGETMIKAVVRNNMVVADELMQGLLKFFS